MIHIIKVSSLYSFTRQYPQFTAAIEAWAVLVASCTWNKPSDIVAEFGAGAIDILGKKDKKPATVSCERVVFDLKGNHIRIIAKYKFHPLLKESRLYLKWIGSHKAYTELCGKGLQYEIEMF